MEDNRNSRKKYLADGDDSITASQKSKLKQWAKTYQHENVADEHCEEIESSCSNISISLEPDITADTNEIKEIQYDNSEAFHSTDEYIPIDETYFSNLDSVENVKNILDFISMTENLDKITTSVKTSRAELMLMILKFSDTYMLPLTAISNLVSLINNIFEIPILPDSRYHINKLFNFENKAQFHTICPNCSNYLGKTTEFDNETCNMCNSSIDVSNLSSNSFVILNPATEISNLIQSHEDYYSYIMHERLNETGEIRDIYDGHCYKQFVNNLPQDERSQYVTAVFNTDGAQRFENSQDSIWPILIQINELPPQFRLNNIVTCGMWFGKSKPQMSTFLHIFVKEMNLMNENGIECTIHGEKRMLKLYMLISCVDAVARAPMQGLVQYNAYNSCSWCLHPGQWHDGSVRFPILNYRPMDRKVIDTITHGEQAIKDDTIIMGVKTVTPLINLPFFNIIDGFVPDYLHCYLAGVAKQITECILKLIKKSDIEQLNSLLLQIKVPNQLCRLTRSLKDRHQWKAREWENWVLYYSVPLLGLVVDKGILQHWSLLAESLYGLLQISLSIEELDKIDELLHKFVLGIETIYGKRAMTYNVHQLLHISKSVYNWGALWAHSTFPFESRNNKLLRAIHSAKGINHQIVRYANVQCSISLLENRMKHNISTTTKRFCRELTIRVQKCIKNENIMYFGSGNIIEHDVALKCNVSIYSANTYNRIVKAGCLYTSCLLRNNRSNNSYAQLNNKKYIKIISFILDIESNIALTTCNNINAISYDDSNYLCKITSIDNDFCIVETKDIENICVCIHVNNDIYIAAVPNLLFY